MTAQPATGVIFEIGRKRVFASAVDWPGWCRSGRGEEQALEALAAYLPRYAPVARRCGLELPPAAAGAFAIVERLPGSGVTAGAGRLAGALCRPPHRLARARPRLGDRGQSDA